MDVAVKIQYPGVAASITSDLDNLRTLVLTSRMLPKGLYLDNTIKVVRRELALETDYIHEAACMKRFKELLANDSGLYVPEVLDAWSGPNVLTTEMVSGTLVSRAEGLPQDVRDMVRKQHTEADALCSGGDEALFQCLLAGHIGWGQVAGALVA
jgi:predicted unusual protein kinase regulating ubiquinone biosynthesis (AarF/ABC1/UbiB family)